VTLGSFPTQPKAQRFVDRGGAAKKLSVMLDGSLLPPSAVDTSIVRMRVTYDLFAVYPQRGGATAKSHLEQFATLEAAEKYQMSWECREVAEARRSKDRWAVRDATVPIVFVIDSVLAP